MLGLLRAVRRGAFPHLTHILIDPDSDTTHCPETVALDVAAADGEDGVRSLKVTVKYAHYFVDEATAPLSAYDKARLAAAAQRKAAMTATDAAMSKKKKKTMPRRR